MSSAKFTMIFGWVLLVVGVLGFIPGITTNGHLLGVFEVDMVHNIIHILSGIAALIFAKSAAKMFLRVFGLIYLLVAIIGWIQGNTVLGLFSVNTADHILHLLISVIALWFGFRKNG